MNGREFVEPASSCWERGCAHTLQPTSRVASGTSNSPRGQGHGTPSVPAAIIAVQRPDAIVREKGGAGCIVVLTLLADRKEEKEKKEKKEEAI